MKYIIILMALSFTACQSTVEHEHDEEGNHIAAEIPSLVHTVWTNKSELFVEFPALIVGQESRFAAHFTSLEKHKAVTEGSLTISLLGNQKGIRQTVDRPASVGIFKPTLVPKQAGAYQLKFELKTPTISDTIVIRDVVVYKDIESAIEALKNQEEKLGSITFLKEQAWKIDFQTAAVVRDNIYEVIPTSGIWEVAPSDYKTMVATTNGVVEFLSNNLTEGSEITKGQALAVVNSSDLSTNNLRAEIQKAKAIYEQAKSEYYRKKQLYDSKIVPKSEFEEAQERYQVSKSTYETLSAGYSNGGKKLVAPFDGFTKSLSVGNGDFVDQGAPILTVSKHQSSVLKVQISSKYALNKEQIKDVWYQPSADKWSSLSANNGEILSVGKEVNSNKPLIAIYAKVNDLVQLPEGSYTNAQIAFGQSEEVLTIPETALLEDYGRYSVIVQISGESFERRDVTIGKRNGKKVEITNGLQAGEVVVTNGAYQVKMASMSGQAPAHGHDH